jgi:hydroxyacylglutathione hydrolase
MTNPVKVYPIVSPWGRFGLYSFFIDAPEPAIVDTGIAVSPSAGIAPALEDLGRSLEEVRWILLTHGHPDHLGGAHAAWEATGRQAQVAIHSADAGLLRSRRAHVDSYVKIRQQYLNDPEGVAKQEAMAAEVISGEMDPTVELQGGEQLSLGGGVTVSVHHTPGHTAGSVTYMLDGQDWAFAGDAVQIHGAANRFPGYENSSDYRNSLRYLRDELRPKRLFMGHHFMDSAGRSYDVELEGDDVTTVLQKSIDIEAKLAEAARRHIEDGTADPDTVYGPFASIAADVGYTGDPTMEPSPFFTTMNGYRNEFASIDVSGGVR